MGLVASFPREAVQRVYDEPLYDENSALELMMLVGHPDDAPAKAEAVAYSLNELSKNFAFALWREVQASTPEREKQAKRLVNTCQKVLEIVGVADGGEMLEMFGPGGLFAAANLRGEAQGRAATMNALHAVELLRQDALKMLEIESKRRRMKGPKVGHPGHRALQYYIRDLSCLYEATWLRSPGISNGEDEPSGPFMRFMCDAIDRVKSRGLRFWATPDSLRKHWQRLPADEKMPLTVIAEGFKALDAKRSDALTE